ncbi:GerAB/ArcD/ProY family transporter [Paenibacillus sp. 1001270B_150601_E10]|uniref:GerAB/ArcD/ProY family transporter n=1 Tax=Paenibacillus sp. 1001270B_150601_E10 TaxID=2787079 RepID=UPI00189DE538|nr:endospore germination permease [Paenibacillus sp. 1001270B_150601_E10]
MKITGIQLFWLMICVVTGLGILYALPHSIEMAKQDAWISIALGGFMGAVVLFVMMKVNVIFPNQSIIQYSQSILGKWGGRMIAIPYLLMWYVEGGMVLRSSTDFIYITLFNKTPIFILSLMMLILAVYIVYVGGIVGIARCSEIMGPLILFMVVFTCMFNLSNMDWNQITPIYTDSGWRSIVKGSVTPLSFFGDVVVFSMVFCFAVDMRKSAPKALWGLLVSILMIVLSMIVIITTFGPNLSYRLWFPYYHMTRLISVFGFIENLDFFAVVVWMFSMFIKSSLVLFAAVYGTAQWFNVQQWRKLLWVVAPTVLCLSLLPKNINEAVIGHVYIWQFIVLPLNIIAIPLLLWVVGILRHHANKRVRQS